VDCGITEFSSSALTIVEQILTTSAPYICMNITQTDKTDKKLQLDVDCGIINFSLHA
jgi:hypothetical protein